MFVLLYYSTVIVLIVALYSSLHNAITYCFNVKDCKFVNLTFFPSILSSISSQCSVSHLNRLLWNHQTYRHFSPFIGRRFGWTFLSRAQYQSHRHCPKVFWCSHGDNQQCGNSPGNYRARNSKINSPFGEEEKTL